jgi:hypothetical protein
VGRDQGLLVLHAADRPPPSSFSGVDDHSHLVASESPLLLGPLTAAYSTPPWDRRLSSLVHVVVRPPPSSTLPRVGWDQCLLVFHADNRPPPSSSSGIADRRLLVGGEPLLLLERR